ncbi:MAG: hypothetical protein GXO28_04380 [Methanopyri archaeon]|nr:hypothetical protein [Methanopyri archaeon]
MRVWAVALAASSVSVVVASWLFRRLDGPLYEPVRGGTPRGVGIGPALVVGCLAPRWLGLPVLALALPGFVDDAVGRRFVPGLGVEVGHLARGFGMLAAAVSAGWWFGFWTGLAVGFLPQPANIVDTQPRAWSFAVGVASLATLPWWTGWVGVVWAALVPYVVLDARGRVMLGDCGNSSLAVAAALACSGGDPVGVWVFVVVFVLAGAFYRFRVEPVLRRYLEGALGIPNPSFMDAVWDVVTGGALGDLVKALTFGRTEPPEVGRVGRLLGLRRLVLIGRSSVGERVRGGDGS